MALIADAVGVRDRARKAYEEAARAAGIEPEVLTGPAQFMPASKISEAVAQAVEVGVDADVDTLGADIVGLRNLNLYGLKGVCAYAHHAHALGYRSDDTDAGIESGLAFLAGGPTEADALLGHALELGAINLKVMEMLDAANTGSFGSPVPTPVRITPSPAKRSWCPATTCTTWTRFCRPPQEPASRSTPRRTAARARLPGTAQARPSGRQLRRRLAGPAERLHRVSRTHRDDLELPDRAPTRLPQPDLHHRTSGLARYPPCRYRRPVAGHQGRPVPAGFAESGPEETVTTGFAHGAVMSVADKVIEAVKAGDIKRFLLIGGCDGAAPGAITTPTLPTTPPTTPC